MPSILLRGSFGDELNAVPVVKALSEKYGEKIYVNANYSQEIFKNNPYVSRTETYDDVKILKLPTQETHLLHLIDHYARQAEVDVLDRKLEIFLDEEDAVCSSFFKAPAKKVAVDTRCGWPIRQWPLRDFAEVCEMLQKKGVLIVEVGKSMPNCFGEVVDGALPNPSISYLNKLTIRQTASVISQCDAFLGCDSGLAHLATAVGVPAVTLFGPIHPASRAHALTIPVFTNSCDRYAVKHLYCEKRRQCMRSITPRMVDDVVVTALFKPNYVQNLLRCGEIANQTFGASRPPRRGSCAP
jgi:ADP-heptose:LPS heptosyltransferase